MRDYTTITDDRRHLLALAAMCVKCGLCLPHCPSYSITRNEADSPRGRISLLQGMLDGQLDGHGAAHGHLERCLGCRRCEAVCPSRVPYARLLFGARASGLWPVPARQRALTAFVSAPRWAWFRRLVGRVIRRVRGTRALFKPDSLQVPAAGGGAMGRVGLLPGCGLDLVAPDLVEQAKRLLHAVGYDVVVLQDACCGALFEHQGRDGDAARRAGELRTRAAGSGIERVLTLNPVCAAAVRDTNPGCPADEICSFLAGAPALSALRFAPLPARAAVHLPCTQASLGWRCDALAILLARIPELKQLALQNPHGCCGAAGLHSVLHPADAAAMRAPLVAMADAAAAEYLVSSNPGCAQHIAAGYRGARPIIAHPVALLAQQLSTEPEPEQPS